MKNIFKKSEIFYLNLVSLVGIHHPLSLKLLTRLRLRLSLLNEHRCKRNTHFVHFLQKSSQLSIFSALLLLFTTLYFFLKWFKQHFTIVRTIFWRRVSEDTTLWQSNVWWKWQSRNTWNVDKIHSTIKKI